MENWSENWGRPLPFQATFTNYTSSDCNGFRPDLGAQYSFAWNSPPFNIPKGYAKLVVRRRYKSLTEYSLATGQDTHSILVDYDIFMNVKKPDHNNLIGMYQSDTLDFRLRPDSVGVDAGCILPNVNDAFAGRAPDIGALEVGQPLPVYGPRP